MIPLATILSVAPQIGLPKHKTALMRRLERAGARWDTGPASKGRIGRLYVPETLPAELRKALGIVSDHTQPNGEHSGAEQEPASLRAYHLATPSQKAEAERRVAMMLRLDELRRVATAKAEGVVASEFGVSTSAVKAAWRLVRGRSRSDWLALLTKHYRGSVKMPIAEAVWRYFASDYGRQEQPQILACYERTVAYAERNGLGPVPSWKTLQRRFDALPMAVRILMREGEQALAERLPHQERDRSGMRALDGANMDSRTWDVWVLLPDDRVVRLVVTVIQDEATNFILGYEVTEAETGASYRRVMCAAFETYGLPDQIRFDNTRAAANKQTTGGSKGRYRFTDRADDPPGLLTRLGVRVRFTRPRNGRAKLIERGFAELKERSEKHPKLAGAYTGRSPTEKPANYRERAAPLADFLAVLAEAVEHYNDRADRRSKVAWKKSHRAIFEAGLAGRPVRRLTAEQRRIFFLSAVVRTVTPSGAVLIGTGPRKHRYHDPALEDFAGREVVVRYDENDMAAPVVVETLDGRLIADPVARIEVGRFESVEDAGAYRRANAERMRAAKAHDRALERMDAIELAQATPVREAPTPPDKPEVAVVQGTFRRPTKKAARQAPPAQGLDTEALDRVLKYLPDNNRYEPTPDQVERAAKLERDMEFLRSQRFG